MSRWQGKLERKQGFLGRIVDIGAELFAMSASCVRARAQRNDRPEGVELADLFCEQARVRIDALFDGLWNNTDDRDVATAKKVMAGRYTSFESGITPPPQDGDWVASWAEGASTEQDARRRVSHPERAS
jgi:hypothetical protein